LLIPGWKRLLLAEGPRQVLNAITLYSVAAGENFSFDIQVYQQDFTTIQGVVLSFMLLTVVIWALSFIRLLVAGLLYWPLLVCHIRGNLKEYCCHKVDKRISQILADRRRRRFDNKVENKLDSSSTFGPDAAGKFQPTLPKVELDGDGESVISMPLYPLSRTDTVDSRSGLLRRTESTSTIDTQRYMTRTPTNPYSTTTSLTRTDTNISDSRSLSRGDSGSFRQPTLPHLAGDFSIPPVPRPTPIPRIDTRGPPRQQGSMSGRSTPGYSSPMSARSEQGFGPPPRSNTNPHMETGFGPPPRSNTFGGMSVTPRRPERPFDSNSRGYPVPR
jgi:Fungal potassium channel